MTRNQLFFQIFYSTKKNKEIYLSACLKLSSLLSSFDTEFKDLHSKRGFLTSWYEMWNK